jgi:DNA-binding PadR family transcriptional regulator
MSDVALPSVTNTMLDVLGVLLQAWDDDRDVHGWQLIKSARRSGPSVYKVLDRLEDAGWVSGVWEVLPAGQIRPRRRYYRLTPTGEVAARERQPVPAAAPPRRLRTQPGFGMVARLRTAR